MKLPILLLLIIFPLKSIFGDGILFSNSQNFDPEIEKTFDRLHSIFGIDWLNISSLPEPPNNLEDAARLVEIQKSIVLDEDRKRRIEAQNIDFRSDFQYDENLKPHTKNLLTVLDNEVYIAVILQKLKYDRARPSFFNKNINLIIPNPGHPSYPSGHATQSYMYGLIFSHLNEEKKDEYLSLANDIGTNREFAGVHYRSDTYAGQIYAKFILLTLFEYQEFAALFMSAADEWGDPLTITKSILTTISK